MTMAVNGAVRCDGCGRLSRHPLGYYQRPDGTGGHICSQGRNSDQDFCDECEIKNLKPKLDTREQDE